MNIILKTCLLAGLSAAPSAHAQVVLLYNERPPYLVTQDGALTGLTGSAAVAAFKAANIPFTTQLVPSIRQLVRIRNNTGADCAVGWFKTEERMSYAKFTKPIYQDHPQIALTAAGAGKLTDAESLESALSNQDISLLVKQGYSYGTTIDELIAKLHPKLIAVSGENTQMLRMIRAGRADYMFAAPEEADGLITASGINPAEIRKVSFSDAPHGEYRYILCSRNVSDEVIERLNRVIK